MNYDTSPVSIKKRKQRSKTTTSSTKMDSHITGSSENEANKEPCANATETPVRKNEQISDSPQFMEFAESPEFRVGWDDGFEPVTSHEKIKMDETVNNSKKKSKKHVFVRTLRTQRLLNNCQPETVITEDEHPDSDEFLQWAESLLCGPSNSENQLESPKNINSSMLNQSSNNNIGIQSPKINDMKTPKRPVLLRSPSSNSTKQGGIFRSSRKKSYISTGSNQKVASTSFRNLQESPLVKHSNETSSSKLFSNEKSISNVMKSPANVSISNNVAANKDEFNDFFNDSINELMIQCSQAVESKLNKENSDLKNLLDDSSNDLLLQCTQQVEEKLMQQNFTNKNEVFRTGGRSFNENIGQSKNLSDTQHKSIENNSIVKQKINNNNSVANNNVKKLFVPKQASNLHKLDSPNTILFDHEDTNNVISSINKQFMSRGLNNDCSSSPIDSRGVQRSTQKTSNKHFLSPTTKGDTLSRKKFCHNNNVITSNVNREYAVTSCNNQDLNSILSEDEDLLSNLDIDQVLSQVPTLQAITKPNFNVPENKTCTQSSFKKQCHESSNPKQNTISFNGFKPNPVKSASDLKNKSINVQKTMPLASLPDVVPKYTQEEIQMKKIEAKRRQALKLRERQKSFEIK